MEFYDGPGIYQILNIINGKRYIGLSIHCNSRWMQHCRSLNKNSHYNRHLQKAWNKYGEDVFVFEVIERVEDVSILGQREVYWIQYYDACNSGYNQSLGGDGTPYVIYSKERNNAISKSLSGRVRLDMQGGNAFNARRVVCINNGRRFDSIITASKEMDLNYGGILLSCDSLCTVGKDMYVFLDEEEYDSLSEDEINSILDKCIYKRLHHYKTKGVICLNTMEKFSSITEASKKYGIDKSNILGCCNNRQKSCGTDVDGNKLVWRKLSDFCLMSHDDIREALMVKTSPRITSKEIIDCATNHKYESISEASIACGVNYSTLYSAIKKYGLYKNNDKEIFLKLVS